MKKKLNVFLLSALPLAALIMTSCGKHNVSYKDALTYAVDHFDNYSLDAIPVDYTFMTKKFGVDFDLNIYDDVGMTHDYKIAFGLDNITSVIRNQYAYCMSSLFVNEVQNLYSTISSFAEEELIDIPVDLFYDIKGNGGMAITLGTGDAGNNLVNLFKATLSALTAVGYLPDQSIEKIIYSSLFNSLDNLFANLFKLQGRPLAAYIVASSSGALSINVDPNSFSTNDQLRVSIESESHGYTTNADFRLSGDLDLSMLFVVNEDKLAITESRMRTLGIPASIQELGGMGGRYTLVGTMDFNAAASADFI